MERNQQELVRNDELRPSFCIKSFYFHCINLFIIYLCKHVVSLDSTEEEIIAIKLI